VKQEKGWPKSLYGSHVKVEIFIGFKLRELHTLSQDQLSHNLI
jgi:hypothetical protein